MSAPPRPARSACNKAVSFDRPAAADKGCSMTVTLLYIDGCAGWQLAQQRLLEAARQVGVDEGALVYQEVNTPKEAQRLSFRGSPTILIHGRDPFPGGDTGSGLSCRLYDSTAGPEQAPSVEQLIAALREYVATTMGGATDRLARATTGDREE